MNHFKFFLLISLVAASCSQTYNVVAVNMSNSFNPGQVLKLKNKPEINRGDAVFFKRENSSRQKTETWLSRVVAFSGDTIEIKDGDLTVNNNISELPVNARLRYILTTTGPLDVKSLTENTVNQVADNKYIADLTRDEYTNVSQWPNVSEISRLISSQGKYMKGTVRNTVNDNWNDDQFGPLFIPSVGEKIRINQTNSGLYAAILPDLQPDSTITVKEKLYFLMGDNRSNSADSRYIGLITESDIIGYTEEKQ